VSAFPLKYSLAVEPTGTLGHTPRLWMGLRVGVGWE